MQNWNRQGCGQGAALPLDPDSVILSLAEATQPPTASLLVQVTPPGDETASAPVLTGENAAGQEPAPCRAHGLCLPQPYPSAVADAQNERYARIIRNSFSGRESALAAMMTYLYQAIRLGGCNEDLRETLWGISVCKMYHMRLFGELLLSLGSDPKYFYHMPQGAKSGTWWSAQAGVVNYAKNLGDALKAAIEAEKSFIAEHKSAINYIDDPGVCVLLRRIVLDEEYHLALLTELYQRFCS